MQRLIALLFTVFALAAVPAAFADSSTPVTPAPAPSSTPASPSPDPAQQNPAQQDPAQQAQGRGHRLEILRLRIQLAELRFATHCGSNSTGASQRCLDFAAKVEERLTKLDTNIQARIAKIQQTCTSSSADEKCKHATERVDALQKIDTRVEALVQKVKDWLDGKTVSGSPSSSDSSLDKAAAGLGKASQQVGAGG